MYIRKHLHVEVYVYIYVDVNRSVHKFMNTKMICIYMYIHLYWGVHRKHIVARTIYSLCPLG